MRVSQLLKVMDRDKLIVIDNLSANIENMTMFQGPVKGIKKEDPINSMHVEVVDAVGDILFLLVSKPTNQNGFIKERK